MAQTRMRAVLVKNGAGGVENLYIGETPKPSPAAGQVLVKVCRKPFIFSCLPCFLPLQIFARLSKESLMCHLHVPGGFRLTELHVF